MTKKQKRKIAQEIVELNTIHDSASSTEEERQRAEKRIFSLTEQILSSPHGLELMEEIDSLIQTLI